MLARTGRVRHGAAAAETAVVLPLLVLLALGTTDLGRFSRAELTVNTAARLGAEYAASSIDHSYDTDAIIAAARYEAESLPSYSSTNPVVTVTRTQEGPDDASVVVTVSYEFRTLFGYAALPKTIRLTRSVHMRVLPVQSGDEPEEWEDPDET